MSDQYRENLPNRRANVSIAFVHVGHSGSAQEYTATVGFYHNGRIGEVFCGARKVGTDTDIAIKDASIAISLALQHGCPIDAFRNTFMRNPNGSPEGPLGTLLDLLVDIDPPKQPEIQPI